MRISKIFFLVIIDCNSMDIVEFLFDGNRLFCILISVFFLAWFVII